MQKRSVCFYTSNNGVGLVADVSLLQDLLYEHYDIDVVYFDNSLKPPTGGIAHKKYDVGIWLQTFSEEYFEFAEKNIFIPNEEWLDFKKLSQLKKFDKIICKSTLGQQLLRPYNSNVVVSGFISKDRYNPAIKKQDKFIHIMGKSAQKGTECILNNFLHTRKDLPLTIIESREGCTLDKTCTAPNVNYIKGFIAEEDLNEEFNRHSIHLCPSIYEGWGHYLYEALSVGALTYVTKLPMFLEWLDPELVVFLDCKFEQLKPARTNVQFLTTDRLDSTHQFGWLVDQDSFDENVKNYKQHLEKHNPDKVRKFFNHLNEQNSKNLIEELTDI